MISWWHGNSTLCFSHLFDHGAISVFSMLCFMGHILGSPVLGLWVI